MRNIFLLSLIISCSNLSSNRSVESEFYLNGGKIGEHRWDRPLIFKRISWYAEVNLLYDILYTTLPENSPFWHLFSDDEKRAIDGCSKSFIVMDYALDPKRISSIEMQTFAEKASFTRMAIPSFANALATHPDFHRHFLHRYDIYALCRQGEVVSGEILLNFPHFDPHSMD